MNTRRTGLDQQKAQEATVAVAMALKEGFTHQEIHAALMANLAAFLAAGADRYLGARAVSTEEKEIMVGELAEWSRKKHDEMMARHENRN